MSVSPVEAEILKALEDYFGAIERQKGLPSGQGGSLRSHFERLDELAAGLPPGSDPQLRHYMLRKSYEKALEFLRQRFA